MAILNLAVNARDAMPHSRHLRMEAGVTERRPATLPRHGRFARLAVVDSGTGMDEATLARALDPFFSTKGVRRGTGLGLSMVHGLASQLGGALELRNRPRGGHHGRTVAPHRGRAVTRDTRARDRLAQGIGGGGAPGGR